MIKECNFKDGNQCDLTRSYPRQRIECPGEENCILYQIYKNTLIDDSICYKNRIPV